MNIQVVAPLQYCDAILGDFISKFKVLFQIPQKLCLYHIQFYSVHMDLLVRIRGS